MKRKPAFVCVSCVFLTIFFLTLLGCGGGSGGSNPSGDNGTDRPAGKVIVDGHLFNPDFVTSGKDYYVKISYFNGEGMLQSHHNLFTWSGAELTYGREWTYLYDESGHIDRIEEEFTYTREAAGGLYEHEFLTTVNEYDATGNLIEETRTLSSADYNGDGVYDDAVNEVREVTTHEYVNNVLMESVVDDDGDGRADSSNDVTLTYYYDDNDQLYRKDELFFADIESTYTSVYIYTYDTAGRKETETRYATLTDYDGGTANQAITYTYDDDGNLIKEAIDSGVAHTSDRELDGEPDDIIYYNFGDNGEIHEKVEEEIHLDFVKKTTTKYTYEVRDDNGDGVPEAAATYVMWTEPVYDRGEGYPPEALPDWYVNAQSNLNNNNDDDGWGLNWDGHDTGTCNTCGNMIGEVNKILLGF